MNETKIKGGCQSGRKVAPHDSKSGLPLLCHDTFRFLLNRQVLIEQTVEVFNKLKYISGQEQFQAGGIFQK